MFVVKVPGVDGLGKTDGCEKAGNAILKALYDIKTNEQGKKIDVKSLDLEEIHLDNSNLEFTNQLIYENSKEMFETKEKTIFLGGDHSVSYSLVKSFLDYCAENKQLPFLVVFDSHADCMESLEKQKRKFPSHREWLRRIVELGFPSQNILIVGAHAFQENEFEFLKQKNIQVISINNFVEDIQEMGDIITEFSRGKNLYVSLDLDVLDCVFAPGTSYPESGGFSSRNFLYLIQRVNKIKNLRAIDLVNLNLKTDEKEQTVKLAAKILSELI